MKRLKKIFGFLMTGVLLLSMFLNTPFTFDAGAANSVVINLTARKQTIQGFGGMNHPVWTSDLTPQQRNTTFRNGAGDLGFTILRIHVDENQANWYKELDTAKAAVANGAIVFASPWNPPASMTENFYKNGNSSAKRLRHDKYGDYVRHLNNFVKYMKDNGVDLYAISVQNEPDYANEWTWWTPQEVLDFMKNYAGGINCRVIAPESFQYLKNISDPILNDPQALANMDILGAHLYGTQVRNFPYPLFEQKGAGKGLWMTEVYYPNSNANSADSWPEALEVSYHIHSAMTEGNFQAYVWWFIRRNYSPLKEDGTISKRGYNMAHFSKFVRPGYVRVDATKKPSNNVYTSAYIGDNKIVIVAINKGNTVVNQNFVLQNGTADSFSSWVTDGRRNMASSGTSKVSNNSFTSQLPAQSVTTYVADLKNGSGSGTYYEAETNATLKDATVESLYNGYTGSGYVNFNSQSGSSIEWNNVYCALQGTKNITVRYALESGSRYLDVYVNGTKVANNVAFDATGSWESWGEKVIPVDMIVNMNSFKLVTTGSEGPNVDRIYATAKMD